MIFPIKSYVAVVVAVGAFAAQAATGPEVLRATLTNGLSVIIVRNTLAPVVTTVINYRVGSDECPPGFPGTAHALEHIMFRGSPGLSAEQLADITAALGGDSNADTQQPVTQYFFTAPAEDLSVPLRIEALRMRGLLTDEKLWNKERGAIEQEVAQDLSNPEYVFYMKLLEALFKGTPYEHDPLGTRPSFDKTTSAMLQQFHSTWYVPNNAILIIVGDVEPANVLKQIKEFFEPISAGKMPARPEWKFQPVSTNTIQLESDLPVGLAAVTWRFPGSDSPDFAAAQILADVLSSQRGKLYGLVPDGKALSASFSYDTLPKAALGYAMVTLPAESNAVPLLEEVRAILDTETTNGVVAELVEAAKRREIASAEFQKNSVFGLAMAWSQAVAVEGRQSPDDDIEAIRRVTVEDVDRVARKYLVQDQAIAAILKPQPSGKPVSSKSFGGKETFATGHSKGVKIPAWAADAMDRTNIPPSTLNPLVTNLPDGLKVIVQPQTVSDSVSVYGRVRNNPKVQESKGQEGVHDALSELFSYGTKSLDRLAFQKALDDIGANESAGADFSLQVLTDQFERGVQLLADNELSPALPEEAFKTIQPQLAAEVAGQMQSPGYLADRAVLAALFPKNDPVRRETTPATVQALSIQNLQDYYQSAFRPDLTTIVVIGKVSPEKAVEVVAKYFGQWKAVGPRPNTFFPPAPANAPSTTQVPDVSRVQDKVTLGQTMGLTRTNEDYYALELGNHVLGGAFYATRLYRDLREENGLVYFVAPRISIGLTRAVYQVEYACDPPNVSKARAIVVRDLEDMRTKPVTAHELRQAQVLLLREIPLAEASVESVAQGWLSRSGLELPLDEPSRAARRYLKLSAEDIRSAFAKWLRPNDVIQVTQGPAPK